jgi:hypothetical protein
MALLQVLPQHLPTGNYAVKGGANLRLFMESPRRSEDIDFNFLGQASWSLPSRMEAVLRSPALAALLSMHGLRITSVNPSKTTTTTGRWKFQLAGTGLAVSSKVEFSMRGEDKALLELSSVSARLASLARMRPALANHYTATGAIEQKIAALALRLETQVRDVFDLDFLFTKFPTALIGVRPNPHEAARAQERIFEVTYREYRDLVLTYLDPAFVQMYSSQPEWERMALHVATTLDLIGGRK